MNFRTYLLLALRTPTIQKFIFWGVMFFFFFFLVYGFGFLVWNILINRKCLFLQPIA